MKPKLHVIEGRADELREEGFNLMVRDICYGDESAYRRFVEIDRTLARRGKLTLVTPQASHET